MIQVTRFNGSRLYVNADMICFVEATPDTVISLSNGEKIVVKETSEQIVAAMIAYQRQVRTPAKPTPSSTDQHPQPLGRAG